MTWEGGLSEAVGAGGRVESDSCPARAQQLGKQGRRENGVAELLVGLRGPHWTPSRCLC